MTRPITVEVLLLPPPLPLLAMMILLFPPCQHQELSSLFLGIIQCRVHHQRIQLRLHLWLQSKPQPQRPRPRSHLC